MSEKVREVLDLILEKFRSGDIPEAVALASFPAANIPSATWSLLNRTLMFLGGTGDARGFRQWKAVNRHVVKGGRAIFILVPCFKKERDDSGEEKEVLVFFKAAPVFRYEDTEGEALAIPDPNPELPPLPLMERALELGVSVRAISGDYKCHGYYSMRRREIVLATPEESVFFHELAHAAHEKVKGKLTPGQDPLQEIVAELSAQALCRIVGRDPKDTMGNSFRYIENYAAKIKVSPHAACLRVLSETEKVLNLITKGEKMRLEQKCQQHWMHMGITDSNKLKAHLRSLFEEKESQSDVLIEIYRLVLPEWEIIEHVHGHPECGEALWQFICREFVDFDRRHHPDVMPGGLWLNTGFSSNRELDAWEISLKNCNVDYIGGQDVEHTESKEIREDTPSL